MAEQKAGGYSTKYRFTSKEVDEETGLYYFGARYYDPRISLWYGVDLLAEKYPTWNPFGYTLNNPIRFIDPTGMESEDSDGGGDPKKEGQNPQQPPIPHKPVTPQNQDPNAPPAGRGIELTKNLPKQESNSLDPPISNDHPIGQESMIDFSDVTVKGGLKLGGKFFVTKIIKDGLEEGGKKGLKFLSKKWVTDVPIMKQIPGQLGKLSSRFDVKGFSIDDLVKMTPSELETFVKGKPGAQKVFQQINKALQDGGHYYNK